MFLFNKIQYSFLKANNKFDATNNEKNSNGFDNKTFFKTKSNEEKIMFFIFLLLILKLLGPLILSLLGLVFLSTFWIFCLILILSVATYLLFIFYDLGSKFFQFISQIFENKNQDFFSIIVIFIFFYLIALLNENLKNENYFF